MPSPEFVAMYGKDLAEQIDSITQSPEQQAAAAETAAQIAEQRRRDEAQLLREICDGADNKVYGKAGQDIAQRFVGEDGKRDYYMMLGLRDALLKAGLLKRSGRKRP